MPPHGLLAKAQSQPRNQLQWKYGGSIPLTLKQTLAAQDWQDVNAYAQAKSGMIETIIQWSRRTDPGGPELAPGGQG